MTGTPSAAQVAMRAGRASISPVRDAGAGRGPADRHDGYQINARDRLELLRRECIERLYLRSFSLAKAETAAAENAKVADEEQEFNKIFGIDEEEAERIATEAAGGAMMASFAAMEDQETTVYLGPQAMQFMVKAVHLAVGVTPPPHSKAWDELFGDAEDMAAVVDMAGKIRRNLVGHEGKLKGATVSLRKDIEARQLEDARRRYEESQRVPVTRPGRAAEEEPHGAKQGQTAEEKKAAASAGRRGDLWGFLRWADPKLSRKQWRTLRCTGSRSQRAGAWSRTRSSTSTTGTNQGLWGMRGQVWRGSLPWAGRSDGGRPR